MATNTTALLEAIEEQTQEQIERLKEEYSQRFDTKATAVKEDFKKQKAALLASQESERVRIEKQHRSAAQLEQFHSLQQAQSDIIAKVMTAIKQALAKESLDAFCSYAAAALQTQAKQANKTIKEFLVPKGANTKAVQVDVKSIKDSLKDTAVLAVISDNEELEYTVQDFIQSQQTAILAALKQEFFND